MVREAQIVAVASAETRDRLEQLPVDVVVNPRLVVTRRSGEEILSRIRSPRPTKARKKLMVSGEDQAPPAGRRPVAVPLRRP